MPAGLVPVVVAPDGDHLQCSLSLRLLSRPRRPPSYVCLVIQHCLCSPPPDPCTLSQHKSNSIARALSLVNASTCEASIAIPSPHFPSKARSLLVHRQPRPRTPLLARSIGYTTPSRIRTPSPMHAISRETPNDRSAQVQAKARPCVRWTVDLSREPQDVRAQVLLLALARLARFLLYLRSSNTMTL